MRGSFNDFRTAHPTTAKLVVEIAVSSLELDRVKAFIYAEAGVKEYWIVRPAEKCVEVHRSPDRGDYTDRFTVQSPENLESVALPGLKVDLAALLG